MAKFKDLEQARDYFYNDHFATENGMVIDELTDDGCICSFEITDRHRNAMGNVMGGAIFTLADLALAATGNDEDNHEVAMDVTVKFLSVAKGDKIIATSKCIKDGRSSSVYEVTITDNTGRIVAIVLGTSFKVD